MSRTKFAHLNHRQIRRNQDESSQDLMPHHDVRHNTVDWPEGVKGPVKVKSIADIAFLSDRYL